MTKSGEVFSFVGVAVRAAKTRRSNPPADTTKMPAAITIPMDKKPKAVTHFPSGTKVAYTYKNKLLTIDVPANPTTPDHVIAIKR